ncbi:MAG: hypothetical protein SFW36_16590 [Leptolyngbyaceae cyanobacterium bins.59]|nr:hypothetical protein [Leptolyngbyaceae cyanobacterium bins.59]
MRATNMPDIPSVSVANSVNTVIHISTHTAAHTIAHTIAHTVAYKMGVRSSPSIDSMGTQSSRSALSLCLLGIALLLGGCLNQQVDIPPRAIKFYQNWQLQPGNVVAGYPVVSGLGDISIQLKGKPVYAPFRGRVEPHTSACVVFSSPEVPAYLFRLCGLNRPHLGDLEAGDKIGSGEMLQFAALRKQPNGTWAFVEPSQSILEQLLRQPE